MADNGINKSKGRRSIKNRTYYAAMPAKVAAKKTKRATKAKAKKDADIKKDLKKNGKPVKGGKTYKEQAAERLRKMKEAEVAAQEEADAVEIAQDLEAEQTDHDDLIDTEEDR